MDELEAKTSVLSIERAELKNKLMDSETTTTYLINTQKELEAALVEKESHINQMKENAASSNSDQTTTIKELLQQKDAEPELGKSENSSDSIPTTAEDNSNSTAISESSHNDESIVVGANTENATSETVVDKSENSNDSMPAPAEENSSNTNPSDGSHQDESIVVEAKNVNATTPDIVVLDKSENTNGSAPVTAEQQNSYNTTAWESNQQDNSSSQEQFLKLATNIEDGQLQENKGDANEQSDDAPEGSHSDRSELQQGNQKLIDNQEASKEESDGTRQVEDPQPQGEASNHSRESKVLEKENEKKTNPEGMSSEDSLSEANQNKTQVEPVVNPTDVNPSTSTNNEERRETSKKHRRRRSRSRRNRKAAVEVDAVANP